VVVVVKEEEAVVLAVVVVVEVVGHDALCQTGAGTVVILIMLFLWSHTPRPPPLFSLLSIRSDGSMIPLSAATSSSQRPSSDDHTYLSSSRRRRRK